MEPMLFPHVDESDPTYAKLRDWIEIFGRYSMRNFIIYAKERNLSMSQVAALFHIRRQGVCAVSDLSEELGVSTPAASQLSERLVQQELVSRSEDVNDRRVKNLEVTAKGMQFMRESILARQRWLQSIVERLSPEERLLVEAALDVLIAKANAKPETQAEAGSAIP